MRLSSRPVVTKVAGLLFLLCLAESTLNAQTKADEEAVRKLPQTHCDAWNKHDAHEFVVFDVTPSRCTSREGIESLAHRVSPDMRIIAVMVWFASL